MRSFTPAAIRHAKALKSSRTCQARWPMASRSTCLPLSAMSRVEHCTVLHRKTGRDGLRGSQSWLSTRRSSDLSTVVHAPQRQLAIFRPCPPHPRPSRPTPEPRVPSRPHYRGCRHPRNRPPQFRPTSRPLVGSCVHRPKEYAPRTLPQRIGAGGRGGLARPRRGGSARGRTLRGAKTRDIFRQIRRRTPRGRRLPQTRPPASRSRAAHPRWSTTRASRRRVRLPRCGLVGPGQRSVDFSSREICTTEAREIERRFVELCIIS